MANTVHIGWLNDGTFRSRLDSGLTPTFDFSGDAVSYDFSGLRLTGCNFRGCDLGGSNFRRTHFEQCTFAESNWRGADFFEATFNGGNFKDVNEPDLALNLSTAKAYGFETEFETARPSNILGLNADWEMIGKVGKLPLFGVSTAALVLLPIYFYILAHYNRTLASLKEAFPLPAGSPLELAVANLPLLNIPSLSLASLLAALSLALASAIYSFFCPPLPKEYTLTQWRFQLEKSAIPYKAQAWAHRWLRVACVLFYTFGGVVGGAVLAIKLWRTAKYIIGIA